jgi:CRISPR-associated protein Csm2
MPQPPRGQVGGQRPPQNPSRHQSPEIDLTGIVFGDIQPTLYSDIAEKAAKTVAGDNPRSQNNKPSQLRRFYDELVMLQGKVGSSPQHFEQQHPFIQMLKAKVAYARGRDKVDENFASLLRHIVDQAKDQTTLKQARLFMEAFMAFYKVYRPAD